MKIFILGAGHMGAWFAKKLSRENEVCVYDVDRERVAKVRYAAVLREYSELRNFKPEMLINTVSLQNTVEAFESVIPFLPKDCLLSDVASVKGDIPGFYKKCSFRFASVHPMFGPTFANVDRLQDENVIIIKESDQEGRRFYRKFFSNFGLNIYEYSFDQHDQMISYSLTLPFASTLVFGSCMNVTAVPGTTFRKHMDIAKGLLREDDYLLAEILFNPYSLVQLEKVTSRLEFLKHVIKGKDAEEARRFFKDIRNKFPDAVNKK